MVRIVVMGVAGSGKSTVGAALGAALGVPFVDGDSLHPVANVDKMSAGYPLDDDDRWPWLASVRATLRQPGGAVVACSALARRYRDLLRQAGDVRFVLLDIEPADAVARAAARADHFMGPEMVESQFAALERPAADEADVQVVDAGRSVRSIVDAVRAAVDESVGDYGTAALVADGGPGRAIAPDDVRAHVDTVVAHVVERGARRVLLVPPDHTRLHSMAGPITVHLARELRALGIAVAVLPALGTHVPMSDDDAALLFGPDLGAADLLPHDWRSGLRSIGVIGADEVRVATGGRYGDDIPVAVDAEIFEHDLVVSIGQVVPHEVIGMANFTKNVMVGLGGADIIHRTHFVGAVAGMETIMGRTSSPVRDVVDAAFDRFVAPAVSVLWVLTVVEDLGVEKVLRGLFVGEGGSGASGGRAFRAAAELARAVNVTVVDEPWSRAACWLDPAEFRSTWLGNKAIYRTRMAMADGGELLVLAPGVRRFGEDPTVDESIRAHGYRGTPATLAAVDTDVQLAANLAAAAHLVHGSAEGRFRIVYCTDPDSGGLTRSEVESVGYEWRALVEVLDELGLDGTEQSGSRVDRTGAAFEYVANPALGLWTTADRMGD